MQSLFDDEINHNLLLQTLSLVPSYVLSKDYINFAKCQAYLLTFGGSFIVIFCITCQICTKEFHNKGWKHTMVIPFGVSHYITFQGCACLSVSHLKLSKDFHNIFAYYVRI